MRYYMQLCASLVPLASLAACSTEPDNARMAEVEAAQVRDAAAAGRIFCALDGAPGFRLDCTMDRVASPQGATLVLGRSDAGYRRFRVTSDGRGVVPEDASEQAVVRVIDNGMVEVAVGADRYRLPATIRGGG